MKTKILQSKILLTILVVCVFMLGFVGIGTTTVYAAESGTCGDNLTWTLDDNGVLTISGTGAMYDYDMTVPWTRNNVKSIVIEEGVTHVGAHTCWACSYLTSVTIASSVTSIGDSAFAYCTNLSSVTFKGDAPTMGSNVFARMYNSNLNISVPQNANGYWDTAWSKDDTHHWHEFTFEGFTIADNSKKNGYAEHTFDSTTHECVCGASEHDFNADTHTCSCGAIEVNEHTFPDENFRNWILEQSYGADSFLTVTELAAVKGINVNGKQIADLTGIEYFTALTSLSCNNNKLTSLDVSNNTQLEMLYCSDNNLSSLDLSANSKIQEGYGFSGTNQTVNISIISDVFNMSSLDSSFDSSKAKITTAGASFYGNLLVLTEKLQTVTYTYATGQNVPSMTVTLSITYSEQTSAREVEFQKGTEYIQWRYVGEDDTAWRNLVALSEITGAAGTNGENGKEIELQIAADGKTLQWRYVGDTDWANLFDLSTLKGADGTNGTNGDEIELRKGETHIEWKYKTEADTEWKPLVALDSLKGDKGDVGEKGDKGDTGANGVDGVTPHIGENGNWWIGNTDTGVKAAGDDGEDGVDGVTVVSIVIGSVALLGNIGWGVFFIGKKKKWF